MHWYRRWLLSEIPLNQERQAMDTVFQHTSPAIIQDNLIYDGLLIATVYPEVYPNDMPPLLARLERSHEYIRPH